MDERERILAAVSKPARYVAGEANLTIKDKPDLRVAFCFPEPYEIGMSYLGLQILYGAVNALPGVGCERAFAPWLDMEALLRESETPLWALESGDPLHAFDVLAFSLQYELSYTNVLNMLALGGIPLRRTERLELRHMVMAGGPCAYNPEPISDFIDLFVVGEGEEALPEVLRLYQTCKADGLDRDSFLRLAAGIGGVYIPSFYDVAYCGDGTVASVLPKAPAPATVTKRVVENLDAAFFSTRPLMPSTEVVHDRAMLELFRGCGRGCRFCAAGHTNRPMRFRSPELLVRQGIETLQATGSEEISMVSLSTSDYPHLETLCDGLLDYCRPRRISLSLPSLRADSFSAALMEKVQATRKSGLTFAPEAGTARLRDVINKNLTEDDLLNACGTAFAGGWSNVKLYFMLGLPTETEQDIAAIHTLAQKVFYTWRQRTANKARAARIGVSVSCFVPKPHTPFQWEAQETMESFVEKQEVLRSGMAKAISYHWHDARVSFLEGVLARGDRRQGAAIYAAWRDGCRMDAWSEAFSLEKWLAAFAEAGLDPAFYANRARPFEEILPWAHISTGVNPEHLWRERLRAYDETASVDCLRGCMGCGVCGNGGAS